MANIAKEIRKARKKLRWAVNEYFDSSDTAQLEIVSDPQTETHSIYIPTRGVREIELLHEYGHAILAESVSPLFSGQEFEDGTLMTALHELAAPLRAATDWYVDEWLSRQAESEVRAEVREHLTMMIRSSPPMSDPSWALMVGFLAAQWHRYLAAPLGEVGETYRVIIQAFLDHDPHYPSEKRLLSLVNQLARFTTPWRVRKLTSSPILIAYREE